MSTRPRLSRLGSSIRRAVRNPLRTADPAITHLQVPLRGTCGTPRPDPRVRFTVTPLGGARSDIAGVVDRIVQYLQPPPAPPVTDAPPGPGKPEGPSRYYADSGEEPGRWLGAGAQTAGLAGEVQGDDLAAVLSGRDPHTGERLLSARGSAGRRQAIGAGHHTMVSPTGEKLYGESDAAAALGATKAEVTRMIDVGASIAMSRGLAALGATLEPPPDGAGASYLVPVISGDGNRWVTESELSRCVDARSDGVDPASLTSTGAGWRPVLDRRGRSARRSHQPVPATPRQTRRGPPHRHRDRSRGRSTAPPGVPDRLPGFPRPVAGHPASPHRVPRAATAARRPRGLRPDPHHREVPRRARPPCRPRGRTGRPGRHPGRQRHRDAMAGGARRDGPSRRPPG